MSDVYWPGPDDLGVYDLVHQSGVVLKSVMWTGANWVAKGPAAHATETRQMMKYGYLGVRREAEKPDNAATAQQALDELRACQTKPAESERWFYKWGPVLCQMLGAR